MSISERIEGTIENWRTKWGKALHNFLASFLSWGIELFFNVLGKAAAPKLKPLIDSMEATGEIPPELQPLLNEIKSPTGQVGAMFAQSAGNALIGGALGRIIDAMFLPVAYGMNKSTRYVMVDILQAIGAWLRGRMPEDELKNHAAMLGLSEHQLEHLKKLAEVRLDPASVVTAWRRDKAKYEKLFQDLRDQGWTEDRIEALKFFTLYYPSPAELIHWTAREVFEPEKIEKYGLRADIGKLRREDFYKAGMDDTQIDNHWIAHWEHASWMQIIEMLHRGIIDEQDVKDWFPLVEIAPYWAENLIKIAYTWPTRVDVRRWWDMRTISESRLKELYEGMGYHGENLTDYIKWTKVYTDFPMMITRFKNGWITEDDIRDWLKGLEIPDDRIEQFIQEKTKPEKPAQVEEERKATATEIMKGVKKEYISWEQGVEMLRELGYDKETAEFKLTVYGAVIEGSPETYPEFKLMTQKYRKAMGLEAMEVPVEIIEASEKLHKAEVKLSEVRDSGLSPEDIIPYEKAVSDAKYRYRQLLVKWEAEKKTLP